MASDFEPQKGRELEDLDEQTRAMIARVYSFLKKEYAYMRENNYHRCDLTPLTNVRKRTAQATGVSEHAVSDILRESGEGDSDSSEEVKKPRIKEECSDCECESTEEREGREEKEVLEIEIEGVNTQMVAVKTECVEFDGSNAWASGSRIEPSIDVKKEFDLTNDTINTNDSILAIKTEFEDIPIDIKVENVT